MNRPEMNDVIIDNSKAQPRRQRITFKFCTALFWGVFLYLVHPFPAHILALLGVEDLPGSTSTSQAPSFLPGLLLAYLLFLAGLGATFQAWILYNTLRNRRKREKSPEQGDREVAASWHQGLDREALEGLQRGRVLRLHHDGKGRISRIQELHPCA